MTDPIPPEGVLARMADGTVVPLECVYVGEKDGFFRWEAVLTLGEVPVEIYARVLPARTSITVAGRGR